MFKKYTHTVCTEVEGNTVKLGRGMEASGLGGKNRFKSITLSEISEFRKEGSERSVPSKKEGACAWVPLQRTHGGAGPSVLSM